MKPKLHFPSDETSSPMNTLARVILLYWKHSAVAKRTARNNALSILKILEKVKGYPVRPENVPLTEITPSLVTDYQAVIAESYEKTAPKDTSAQREAKERALRSTRSTITQARSLFSRRGELDMIAIYEANGIEIPESVYKFTSCKVRGQTTKSDYSAPPDSVAQNSLEEIELMRRDAPVYLAFWLAVGSGLRRNEIHHCRWEYIVEVEGTPRVIGGLGKDGRVINVPIQTRAFTAIVSFRKKDGWVIEERSGTWAKRLSKWLRGQGWRTRLTIHELRAYVGSLIYSKDPVAAMRFLRHKNIRTTETSYVRYSLTNDKLDVL
jgi:integrase